MIDLLLALDFGGTKLTAALTDTDHITPGQQSWLDLRRAFSPPDGDAQQK